MADPLYTAVYYPHTVIGDCETLRSALLLWDRLEFIVPERDYKLRSPDNYALVDEALELIGDPKPPSYEQMTQAHNTIEDLITSKLPKDFLLEAAPEKDRYLVFPEKFLDETWTLIRDSGLGVPDTKNEFEDWSMSKSLGLSMMSILAEACAGTQKRTVTDRTIAYQSLANSLANVYGGEFGVDNHNFDRLVTTTIKIVDPAQFSLAELIDFRKREIGDGEEFTKLRHNYLSKIDECVRQLSNCRAVSDIEQVHKVFAESMESDFLELKSALRKRRNDTILSTEVGVGLLALAGMAVTPWTLPSGLLAVAALINQGRSYKADRRDIVKKTCYVMVIPVGSAQKSFNTSVKNQQLRQNRIFILIRIWAHVLMVGVSNHSDRYARAAQIGNRLCVCRNYL